MSHAEVYSKLNTMTIIELIERREALYQKHPSNIESERVSMYLELGLIEHRLNNSYLPFQLPTTLPKYVHRASLFLPLFHWVRPPFF